MTVFTRFKNQGSKTIPNGPPMRPNARASEADIRSQTGRSHTPGGQVRVHHEKIGDHRGHGGSQHTGSENRSKVQPIQAGRPFNPGEPPDAA